MKKNKSSVPSSPPALTRESTQDKRAEPAPSNHRELGRAILAGCDPVEVGRKLLESKSDSVKERALEVIAGWAYGTTKPTAGAEKGLGVRIVWDLPVPPHEKRASAAVPEDPSAN